MGDQETGQGNFEFKTERGKLSGLSFGEENHSRGFWVTVEQCEAIRNLESSGGRDR